MTDANPEPEPDAERPAPAQDAAAGADTAPTEQPGTDAAAEEPTDELAETRTALEERTADLQRLQAEFLNYKRRVDRDRDLIKENATFAALAPIADVLDNIDRAREHGPLEDGFRAVAEHLERVVAGAGLIRYGAEGDPFDPNLHDALSHIGEDPAVSVTTCKVIAKAGYRIGDRVVRAAQVLVVDPMESEASSSTATEAADVPPEGQPDERPDQAASDWSGESGGEPTAKPED